MTNNTESPGPSAADEDIKDLLARLYRQIGISAVAAALEVTSWTPESKPDPADENAALRVPGSKDLAA